MVFSASSAIAYSAYHDTAHYLKRQAVYLVIGLLFAYAAYRIDYHKLRKIAPGVVLVAFVMLVLTLILTAAIVTVAMFRTLYLLLG